MWGRLSIPYSTQDSHRCPDPVHDPLFKDAIRSGPITARGQPDPAGETVHHDEGKDDRSHRPSYSLFSAVSTSSVISHPASPYNKLPELVVPSTT